ncbi:hypothetical protein EJB05_41218, partial [Eragrostis curvula]
DPSSHLPANSTPCSDTDSEAEAGASCNAYYIGLHAIGELHCDSHPKRSIGTIHVFFFFFFPVLSRKTIVFLLLFFFCAQSFSCIASYVTRANIYSTDGQAKSGYAADMLPNPENAFRRSRSLDEPEFCKLIRVQTARHPVTAFFNVRKIPGVPGKYALSYSERPKNMLGAILVMQRGREAQTDMLMPVQAPQTQFQQLCNAYKYSIVRT